MCTMLQVISVASAVNCGTEHMISAAEACDKINSGYFLLKRTCPIYIPAGTAPARCSVSCACLRCIKAYQLKDRTLLLDSS